MCPEVRASCGLLICQEKRRVTQSHHLLSLYRFSSLLDVSSSSSSSGGGGANRPQVLTECFRHVNKGLFIPTDYFCTRLSSSKWSKLRRNFTPVCFFPSCSLLQCTDQVVEPFSPSLRHLPPHIPPPCRLSLRGRGSGDGWGDRGGKGGDRKV